MHSKERSSAEHQIIREWLAAMDRAAELGSRFPVVDLANGSPADEFAKDPEGYRKRAQAIARELATFGGVTVVHGLPTPGTNPPKP